MNRKKGLWIMIAFMALLLSGCGDNELENRSFPLAVGIEKEKDKEDCSLVFNFPVLSEVADENADGNDTTQATVEGKDFFTMQKNYEKNNSKSIDFSHNKALILSVDLIKDEKKLQEFIDYTMTQELMARNTYLFVTDMPMEELFSLDKNLEKPLGTYLEELLESDEDYKNKQIMTLGKLYDERINQMETLYIPVLGAQNKKPSVIASYVLKNGKALKEVPVQTAMDSMLIQGKLKGASYEDADGGEWRLNKIKPSYKFEKKQDTVHLKIEISCEAALENGIITDWRKQEQAEKRLGTELGKRLTQTAKESQKRGFDLANSYKKLGNRDRKAYTYYEERGGYVEALQTEIVIKPTIVNVK